MNIAHIIPGSGGSFYCGNCLRDSKFYDAMRAQGHNVIKVPMYLPLFSDEKSEDEIPVFYGAVSIYLKQALPFLRHAPSWFDRLLNSGPMLRFAAKQANSTRAEGLESMTISMLLGEHGQQKEELEKMVAWLETHFKADVIHISNALLLGLAHKLKERLNVPVVCSLQDEDVWVDDMKPEFAKEVWDLMKEKSKDIDLFISVSQFYTSFMQQKLHLPHDRISTLHLGVDPEDYTYINTSQKARNIGYLSRICDENGADILVDAFILLKKDPAFDDVNLILTGGYTADDNKFVKEQRSKIEQAGLQKSFEILHDFDPGSRQRFFDQICALSVPVRKGEAFGIYLTESLASGVPVVQPALGAFPEIIKKSQGGLCYEINTPEKLREALAKLLSDSELRSNLSTQARESAVKQFNIHTLAEEMTRVYKKVTI